MFRVQHGHINPKYVEYIGDIRKEYNSYLIKTITGEVYTSEEFSTYEQAVSNRGILVRLSFPRLPSEQLTVIRNSKPRPGGTGGAGGAGGADKSGRISGAGSSAPFNEFQYTEGSYDPYNR